MADIKNLYTYLPKELCDDRRTAYDTYERYKIQIPMRGIIVGSSGSQKTNWCLNLINNLNCFHRIYIFAKRLDEVLYKWFITQLKFLERKKKTEIIFYSNRLEDFPEYTFFDPKYNNLVVVDDWVLDDKRLLKKVSDLYCFGRKSNVSIFYITQSYYRVDKFVRENSDYVILKKINRQRDLRMLMKEYSSFTDKTEDELEKIYRDILKNPTDGMLFDLVTEDPKLRVRKNFSPISTEPVVENKAK